MERASADSAGRRRPGRTVSAWGACVLLLLAGIACGSDYDIIVNEIDYRPVARGEGGEFIELLNRGPAHVDLSLWRLEGAVELTFPAGAMLGPGEYLVACARPDVLGREVESARVYGPWRGQLGDAGGLIALRRADGMRVAFVHYKDNGLWPAGADGGGATLELGDPYAEADFARSWHASRNLGGTPGGPNSAPLSAPPGVCINEIGRTGAEAWVELRGANGYAFEGLAVAAGADVSVRQTVAGVPAGEFAVVPLAFAVEPGPAHLLLLDRDGATLLDSVRGRLPGTDGSLGRLPGGGEFIVCAEATPGAPNRIVIDDSIYVTEIMYNPAAPGDPPREDVEREYVGIANRGPALVDLSGWSLGGGVEFAFPEGALIAPGEEIVVAKNAALLASTYPQVAGIFGDFRGRLGNGSEELVLRDARGVSADRVTYGDDGDWPQAADGGGAALVLRTSSRMIDNAYGAAWEALGGDPPGNPGVAPGDVAIAPLIVDVAHDPPVPSPEDTVRIACRVMSVEPVAAVRLSAGLDGAAPAVIAMERSSGTDNDGLWEARIGPFAQGAVIAFGVRAETASGCATEAPGPGKSFLCAVDGTAAPVPGFPAWRIIMTEAAWQELTVLRPPWSNELLDATFIGGDGSIRYNAGVRFRGSTSRSAERKNYHLSLQSAAPFRGMARIDLNRQNTDSQIISMDLLKRAGLPYSQEWFVNLWLHGEWDARYLRVEIVGEDLLRRCFGEGNETGTLYRGWEIEALGRSADFTYLGTDPGAYRQFYENINGDWAHDDYEEIIRLCGAFSPELTPDAEFPARIAERIDVDEWLLFFAVQACLSNNEGNLAKDKGDDYFVYFRPGDGRAVLVPWDFDSSFASSSEPLFRPTIPAVQRLLTDAAFAPRYFEHLERLADGVFARSEMRKRMALISANHDAEEVDADETFITERLGYLDAHVPRRITGGIAGAGGLMLIARGDLWRYFKGTAEPSGGDMRWTRLGFEDSAWPEGPSGFGYGDGDDATVLADMQRNYSTLFIRKRFDVADPAAIERLVLRIDYDDGFSAFLNGQPVARRNVAAGIPRAVWQAEVEREAGVPEEIDITAFAALLYPGPNILAIVGLNEEIDGGDFSLIPELLVRSGALAAGGTDGHCVASGDTVMLNGAAPAAYTRAVTLDGAPADYNPLRGAWQGTVALSPGRNAVRVRALDAEGGVVDERAIVVERVDGMTALGGECAADTVLARARSPYILDRTLAVPAGVRLTIDAGVTIVALGGARIECAGVLEALGDADAPIVFVSALRDDPWCGIVLRDTGTGADAPVHVLRHCVFRTGTAGAGAYGLIAPVNARLLVDRCRFEGIDANAIDGLECALEVRDSVFDTVYEGVHCVRSEARILASTFRHMRGDCDAIDFDE
ncbi:MAG TPA: hypothetical protein DCM87_08230, partial [Planctomycetes bacterium]|nr:hypothetical protein [Planctomycetota bacterium]